MHDDDHDGAFDAGEDDDDQPRGPFKNMSQGGRAAIAVVGILVGIGLIFLGLRSFDSPSNTTPGAPDTLIVTSTSVGSN